jgi:hypothetical protein
VQQFVKQFVAEVKLQIFFIAERTQLLFTDIDLIEVKSEKVTYST